MQKNRSRGSFTQIRFPYPHRINRPIDSTSDEKTVWIPMRSWCAFGRSRKTPLQIPLGGEPLGPTKKQNSLFFREHSQNAFRWRPRPCVDAWILNRTSKFSRKRGKSVSGVAPVYPLMDCGSMSILCNIVVFFFFHDDGLFIRTCAFDETVGSYTCARFALRSSVKRTQHTSNMAYISLTRVKKV